MNIINRIKNNVLLFLVIVIYLLMIIFIPIKAKESFFNSLYYIKEMLMIMPVILLLTSLIDAWVPKRTIESMLGENSGIKGIVFSFLLGSFSAGPIYAAFPVCKTLFKKGANILNIVIIISAWAVIKVPMLANESKFLGIKFMLIRWILTSIAIIIMAVITSKIVKKDEIFINNKEENKEGKLILNSKYCIGCGMCARKNPEIFIMKNKKGVIIKNIEKKESNNLIEEIIDNCPAKAIEFH